MSSARDDRRVFSLFEDFFARTIWVSDELVFVRFRADPKT
jgi:hypothetical protein